MRNDKKLRYLYIIINLVSIVFGAIFISVVISYILIVTLSWINLGNLGKQLIYSIIAVLLTQSLNIYFRKVKITLDNEYLNYMQYIIIFTIPFLFLNKRYLEATILLSILFSSLKLRR